MVIAEPPWGKKGGVTSCSNLTSGGKETSSAVPCSGFFSDMHHTSVSLPRMDDLAWVTAFRRCADPLVRR